MAQEGDDDRASETDRLFRGLPARGEVFDSLDDIGSMDPPAATPTPVQPPRRPPVRPAVTPVPTAPTVPTGEPHEAIAATVADTAELDDQRSVADPIVVDDERDLDGPRLGRALTIVAAVLVAVGSFLVVFPFDVSVGPVTAHCGPPVYEVVVPSDAAFDVRENTVCEPPAQNRFAVGALAVGSFLVIALAHQWSAGSRRRRARRDRRRRARAVKTAPKAASSGGRLRRAGGAPDEHAPPGPEPERAVRSTAAR